MEHEPVPDDYYLDYPERVRVYCGRRTDSSGRVAKPGCVRPRRAVLVLRDVLVFTAEETAQILGTTVPSVNSALRRARASLNTQRPDPFELGDLDGVGQRDLLHRYVTAFEAHDIAGLKAILREDAVTLMPPFPWRLTGAETIAEVTGASDSRAGARLVRCRMNGAQGFGQYRPGDDNVLRPFALVAVQVRGERIAQIVTFLDATEPLGLPGPRARPAGCCRTTRPGGGRATGKTSPRRYARRSSTATEALACH